MAGKEFKAKARTVQKMSRDGLVEENLRTGSRRMAGRASDPGERIGDRPMENYKTGNSSVQAAQEDRNLRLSRRGADAEHADGNRRLEPDNDAVNDAGIYGDSVRNRRMAVKRGSSVRETPSSLQETDDESAGTWNEAIPGDSSSSGARLKNAKYAAALRKERGSGRERNPAKEEQLAEGNLHSAHKKAVMRGKTADQDKNESLLHKGNDFEESGISEETTESLVSQQSKRMQRIRGHPSGTVLAARSASEIRHARAKKQVYDYAATEKKKESRLKETAEEAGDLSAVKEEILGKQKKERLNQEQRKIPGKTRLSFDDADGMIRGSGTGFRHKTGMTIKNAAFGSAGVAAGTAGFAAHAKISQVEEENVGTQAAHSAEIAAENSIRRMSSRRLRRQSRKTKATRRKAEEAGVNRLVFAKEEGIRTAKAAKIEADKKTTIKKFFQKQRQRRMYAAAKKEEKTVETLIKTQQNLVTKAAVVVKEAFVRNSKVFIILGLMGVFFLLISASLTSCTALMQGAGSSVVGTTYPSTDEDIYAVENRYRELERALNEQINSMRAAHPDYDNFRYQIDEITHNPYHLISYFTTKYGEFTYDQVKDELEEIFREQYGLTTSGERNVTLTETKKVRVGEALGQVVTSGYCSCPICCGQWSGGPTASGVYPTAAHTIAVDASTPFVPMGTHVVMNGVEYVVEDTGPLARYGVQFDVFYDDHQLALNHGHQTWDAYLADDNGSQEIEVTTTQTVNRYSVSLTNHNLDTVLRNRLTDDEKVRYSLYNRTFGHRDYLFDLNSLPTYGGNGYTIPPDALSDERFARMIAEAEKHLGTPYVWGGYAPGGFDCSGFVSWVINHCGNGWDYGRLTAEGIRQVCAYVSPEEAKPGDIIFFERTYDTAGASHVGIYVGDGMMIHCGKPVQYTTIHTDYWNSHFLQFGRLP